MELQTILTAAACIISIIGFGMLYALINKQNKKDELPALTAALSDILTKQTATHTDAIAARLENGATEQFKRFGIIQDSINQTLHTSRSETNKQLREFGEQLDARLANLGRANTEHTERVTAALETKFRQLQESNEKRLTQIQDVVDEKLQKTLETRIAKSFEMVGKQLDSVQQGLGEMKNLAADAKSLKNALTNVKERGTYGEARLEKLLSDILAPGQYITNAEITPLRRVEFAVLLPGQGTAPLLLPIDSKFPIEDYNRLIDAPDKAAETEARKALTANFRASAKSIAEKYICPPKTTDFALMFLPTEGLYAEVLRDGALFEELRDKYKVTAVGATTLSAFLASLQMGFKTLAIEQRSIEVWETLRSVKTEFAKFANSLEKAQKQIQTADKTLGDIVGARTRAINRRLSGVEALPDNGADSETQQIKQIEFQAVDERGDFSD